MQRFLGYFSREDKSENDSKSLDLTDLRQYVERKYYNADPNFIKNFNSPLDIGKYRLALDLETLITQKIKMVDEIDYAAVRRILFIAYKLNEFLEQPDLYANNSKPIKSELSNRCKNMSGIIKAAEKYVEEYGVDYSVECYSQVEIRLLFRELEKRFMNVELPAELPKHLKTGSRMFGRTSGLHLIIYDLYQSLPEPKKELSLGSKH